MPKFKSERHKPKDERHWLNYQWAGGVEISNTRT